MATNKIYAETQELCRERALSTIVAPAAPASIQPGVPVLFADGPAVSLTASGGATVTETTNLPPGVTSVTYENGGVGNADGAASFAFDGTWEFTVGGATTATGNGVEVFISTTGTLDLTDNGIDDVHYGWTDYPVGYSKSAGVAPVRIGA